MFSSHGLSATVSVEEGYRRGPPCSANYLARGWVTASTRLRIVLVRRSIAPPLDSTTICAEAV